MNTKLYNREKLWNTPDGAKRALRSMRRRARRKIKTRGVKILCDRSWVVSQPKWIDVIKPGCIQCSRMTDMIGWKPRLNIITRDLEQAILKLHKSFDEN